MNFLLSVAVALIMGASATPSNPALQAFIEESKAEIAQNNIQGADVLYEESFLGPSIVMVQPLPGVAASMLSQIPTGDMKTAFIQEMKGDADSADFLRALVQEKTNLILRLTTEDGGNLDIIVTPADLK